MSRIDATTANRFRFGREIPTAAPAVAERAESMSVAFSLLVLFLMLMYSSIGVLVPAIEQVRPAMVIAIGAVLFTIIEVSKNRTGFRISSQSLMLLALLGVATISTFNAIYLRHAVDVTTDFAKIVLIYFVIENIITTKGRLRRLMLMMVFGGLIPALGTVYHFFTGHVQDQGRAAWIGTFGNPNENAYALIILVPLAAAIAFRSGWFLRLVLIAVVGAYLLGIYFTFSRGGLLGLVAVLGLLGWKQKSIIVKVVMVGMLVGGIVLVGMFWTRPDNFSNIGSDTTVNQRIATFRAGIEMFKDNPLLGVGPGCSMVAYPLYVPKDAHCGCQDQLVIHNAFIQMLSETGILGFLAFAVLIGSAIVDARKVQKIGSPDLQTYAMGIELALWGFVACGLSGGFSWTWFPYILCGLVVAAKQIATDTPQQVG